MVTEYNLDINWAEVQLSEFTFSFMGKMPSKYIGVLVYEDDRKWVIALSPQYHSNMPEKIQIIDKYCHSDFREQKY